MTSKEKFNPGDRVPKSWHYFPMGGPPPASLHPYADGGGTNIRSHLKAATGRQTWLEEGTIFPEDFEGDRVVAWHMLPT